jgi:hypothetical protein
MYYYMADLILFALKSLLISVFCMVYYHDTLFCSILACTSMYKHYPLPILYALLSITICILNLSCSISISNTISPPPWRTHITPGTEASGTNFVR